MSLGKLFENVSTSEFLRDIYIGHCLISREEIMNNVLNRITLYFCTELISCGTNKHILCTASSI